MMIFCNLGQTDLSEFVNRSRPLSWFLRIRLSLAKYGQTLIDPMLLCDAIS